MRYIPYKKAAVLLLTLLLLVGCTTTLPPIDPDDSEAEDLYSNNEKDAVDSALFELSDVEPYSRFMLNLPGMVLITDQNRNLALHYINKATEKHMIFCFDPLCDHSNCPATQIMMTLKCGYHPKDHALYYSIGKGSRMGTELYRLDLETFESDRVWKGNGNTLQQGFTVYGDELLFSVTRADGGYDYMRLQVSNRTIKQIQPPTGKVFQSIVVRKGQAFATFTDEAAHYRIDNNWNTYTPADIPTGGKFFSNDLQIGYLMGDKKIDNLAYGNVVGFTVYTFQTGELRKFFLSDEPLYPKGFDGTYVYYTKYEKEGEVFAEASTLYRLSILNGAKESLCDIDGVLMEIVKFEDTIYYCRKVYTNDAPQFLYGKITELDDIFTAEDFPITQP